MPTQGQAWGDPETASAPRRKGSVRLGGHTPFTVQELQGTQGTPRTRPYYAQGCRPTPRLLPRLQSQALG